MKKVGVKFTHAGVIGPKFGRKNIKAMKKINNKQFGWLEITYLVIELESVEVTKALYLF